MDFTLTNTEALDIEILNLYCEAGLLSKKKHPTLDLWLWKYTAEAMYCQLWTPYLIRCRSLVTDSQGNVISPCMPKFFNLEEKRHSSKGDFVAYEKLDGSLIYLFYYNGEWIWRSSGSFNSDVVVQAQSLGIKTHELPTNLTYGFELTGYENPIVVKYNYPLKLTLLTAIHTRKGNEAHVEKMFCKAAGFEKVMCYGTNQANSLHTFAQKYKSDNREGFVIRFASGERVKIKYAEYLELHRIMTSTSASTIWGILSRIPRDLTIMSVEELVEKAPDEYFAFVKKTTEQLLLQFKEKKAEVYRDYTRILLKEYSDVPMDKIVKKDFYNKVKDEKNSNLLLALHDGFGCSLDTYIWRSIKPFGVKPYSFIRDEF